jgi:hypothetical protein
MRENIKEDFIMLKQMVFSTRYGGRAFDTFCNAMGDKIKDIENVISETDGHIAWRVTYEDDEEQK